jgi:hypothetical protein
MTDSVQWHDITEIQGIGPATKTELASTGISKSEDLLCLPDAQLAGYLGNMARLTPENLLNLYIPQARFLRLSGMTGQYAEGLARSSFYTYRHLVNAGADQVLDGLLRRQQEGIIPESPSAEIVLSWQLEAAKLLGTGLLYLTVQDAADETRIESATVRTNGLGFDSRVPIEFASDERGNVIIEGFQPGKHTIVVSKNGYKNGQSTFEIFSEQPTRVHIELSQGEHSPVVRDEREGDPLFIGPRSAVVERRVDKDYFAEPPPIRVIDVRATGVLVCSVLRRQVDDTIEALTFLLPQNELPNDIEVGDLLVIGEGNVYEDSGMSLVEYRQAMFRNDGV